MSRQSNIHYDPKLTIKQNADKNKVTEFAIRWYIAHNDVDRNKDSKKNIIKAIQDYLKDHPDATKSEVAKNVENPNQKGKYLSLSTVRKYWDYAKGTKKLKGRQRKAKAIVSSDYYDKLDKIPKQAIFDYIKLKYNDELERCASSARITKPELEPDPIKEKIERIITDSLDNATNQQQMPFSLQKPTIEELTRHEEYDAALYPCLGYSGGVFNVLPLMCTSDDPTIRYKASGFFSNMKSVYPFELCGVQFHSAESAYICGLFSSGTAEHIEIQQQLIDETNGWKAKKVIRHDNEDKGRTDWHEFNVQWMLYVVWHKIMGNGQFKSFLTAVPEYYTLIEDTTFFPKTKNDTSDFWGCRNFKIREYSDLVKLYKKKHPDAQYDKTIKDVGIYEGCNVMGKILMICKEHLKLKTCPEIDYDLLRSKHIHLLGQELLFNEKGQD